MKFYGGKKRDNDRRTQQDKTTRTAPKKKMRGGTKALIAVLAVLVGIGSLVFAFFLLYVKPPTARLPQTMQTSAATSAPSVPGGDDADDPDTDAPGTDGTQGALTPEDEIRQMAQELDVSGENRREDFFTLLVVGTDKSGGLTDTIIVAGFDVKTKSLAMLNIPRDTMSKTSKGYHKINSAYGSGGIERTMVEVKNLLGFEVDRYVVVTLDAFINIIDEIGGVEIDVQRNMYYKDPTQNLTINLKKGVQTLGGYDAMGYMRYRKGYADADLGRIRAQQEFYKAVAKKLATPATLLKLPQLADIVLKNVKTDMSVGEMIWIGTNYVTMDTSTIVTETLPNTPRYINEVSYVIPNKSGILKLVNEHFNPYTNDIKTLNLASAPAATKSTTQKTDTSKTDTSKTDTTTPDTGSGDGKTTDPVVVPGDSGDTGNTGGNTGNGNGGTGSNGGTGGNGSTGGSSGSGETGGNTGGSGDAGGGTDTSDDSKVPDWLAGTNSPDSAVAG